MATAEISLGFQLPDIQFRLITSYCSYARPAQPGPVRWLGPKQAQ